MVYKDKIYGKFNINEPILLELIKSPVMQRLKKINQQGYTGFHFPKSNNNRFNHSLGVFYLLRKYGASLEEQIAGLLHDVSHSAFSHCIDYALNEKNAEKQTHQDDIFDSYIRKTEIPKILRKHGIKSDYVLDDRNFPLKETDLPDICADRIDYLLRDAISFGVIDKKAINYFLKNLKAKDGRWFFENYQSARRFSKLYFKMNKNYYSGFPTALMFQTVGDFLKYSLEKGYLIKKDLYTTDEKVLKKAKKYILKDSKMNVLWKRMNKKIKYKFSKSEGLKVLCKSRAIDPFFKKNKKLLKVSDVEKNWKKIAQEESRPKEYFIKFEK